MWDKRMLVTNIHDGDTVTVTLDQGFGDTKEGIRVRLLGVGAPELKQAGGLETRDFVTEWFAKYTVPSLRFSFVMTTARGPRSDREITTLERYVGTVETIDHIHNLNMDVQDFISKSNYPGGIGS